ILFSTRLPRPPTSPLFPYTTLFRSLHAQVCGEQRRLQILQDGWINPALTEKNRVDGLRQRRLRLADRLPQLLEKRRFRLGFSKQGNHPSRASLLAQLKIVADRVTGVVGRRR